MSNLNYSLLNNGDGAFITVLAKGHDPLTARDDHPNFQKIVALVLADDLAAIEQFDVAKTIEKKFKRLSERVTARNGEIFLDGDPINNALTTQILRFVDEGEDFEPLVNFFEKVLSNPVEHSRQQLFKFLEHNGLVISLAQDGDIVAYKGMQKHKDDQGTYFVPSNHGKNNHVIVNGEDFPDSTSPDAAQRPGDIVELPRSEVVHDPSRTCSVGLHIATFDYAKSYGNTRVEVRVNPRDVVSVPNDSDQKVRACRYTLVNEVTDRYTTAVVKEFVSEGTAEPKPEVASGVSQFVGERPPVAPPAIEDKRPAFPTFVLGEQVLTDEGNFAKVSSIDYEGHCYQLDNEDVDWFPENLIKIQDGPEFKVGQKLALDEDGKQTDVTVETHGEDGYVVTIDNTDDRYFDVRADELAERPVEVTQVTLAAETNPVVPHQQDDTKIYSSVSLAPAYESPTQNDLDEMIGRAKRRKRNLVKYAAKHGPWTLVGQDWTVASSWAVN